MLDFIDWLLRLISESHPLGSHRQKASRKRCLLYRVIVSINTTQGDKKPIGNKTPTQVILI